MKQEEVVELVKEGNGEVTVEKSSTIEFYIVIWAVVIWNWESALCRRLVVSKHEARLKSKVFNLMLMVTFALKVFFQLVVLTFYMLDPLITVKCS